MIGEYALDKLLYKYGIDAQKVINKNENILTYGEYKDIDDTLNYLVNELKINVKYIEKAPSIMYLNVSDIKNNVEFLKQKKIELSNVESCLHVLSTKTNELIKTYNYVEKNYGVNVINKVTSILAVSKEKILDIENLNIPNISKNDIISIAIGRNDILEIKKIINSEEFKKYPHLFTSQTLAHAKLDEIVKIINSEEFKKYPHLFTSKTLACAKLDDIKTLLNLHYFEEEKYKRLLTSVVLAKAKTMITKLPILIKMAEDYKIDNYITTTYLLFSPSQNYAIINYLNCNNIPLITDDYKLNPMFGKQMGVLKKKYNIDLKELMKEYPLPIEYKEEKKIK